MIIKLMLVLQCIVSAQAADHHPVITIAPVQMRQPPSGNTIVARSGTAEDIQSAVLSARPGDTIVIPEGRFAFHGQVFLPDGLSIRGAGRDKTWLIKTDRLGEWRPMFSVDCKTGRPFRFSGITLQGTGRDLQDSSNPIMDQGIVLRGRCNDFLIFGSRFTKFSRAG